MRRIAVLYEGLPGVRLATGHLTVVGAEGDQVVGQAVLLAHQGLTRVELCGGMDVGAAQTVRAALPAGVQVRLNRYGFESLELAAAYKDAYGRGEPVGRQVFLVPDGPGVEQVEHPDVTVVPVGSVEQTEQLAGDLARGGVGLVELYAGLGVEHAAAAVRGGGGRFPVGFVDDDRTQA